MAILKILARMVIRTTKSVVKIVYHISEGITSLTGNIVKGLCEADEALDKPKHKSKHEKKAKEEPTVTK